MNGSGVVGWQPTRPDGDLVLTAIRRLHDARVAAGVLATVLCIIGLSAERRSRARRAPAEAGAS